MLDLNYIEYLYMNLPQEKKKELIKKLFGAAKQSINYFKKVKDPGLSKLEILADYFNMPIDGLRLDSKFRRDPTGNEEEFIYYAAKALSKKYDEYCQQTDENRLGKLDFLAREISTRIISIDAIDIASQENATS